MKPLLLFTILLLPYSLKQKKELTWVAIGDSITYLNDHPGETGNRITKGYMTMVTEKLPYVHYTNKGYIGWTSGGIAASISSLGIEKADVYSVFLGTNDWWEGRPVGTLDDYKNNIGNYSLYGSFRIIINKLRSLNSKAKIILVTPMQRGDFVYIHDMSKTAWGSYKPKQGQALEQFANAILAIARQENFDVVDLYHTKGLEIKNMVHYKRLKNPATGQYENYTYPRFINIPFNPRTDEYPYPPGAVNITYDGLHPSDKGFAVIADKLVSVLARY